DRDRGRRHARANPTMVRARRRAHRPDRARDQRAGPGAPRHRARRHPRRAAARRSGSTLRAVAHDHDHGPSADADRRWLAVALGVIATFMVVEVVAGVLADSLALLSDAAHMLTDAAAIAVALFAAGLAARPPAGRFTFGLGRAEILSAQGNGATLLVLAGVIAVEAIRRLWSVPDVDGAYV